MELDAAAVLAALPHGVLVVDRDAKLRYANPAARAMLGLSRSEGVACPLCASDSVAADGTPLSLDQVPALEVLRTGEPAHDVEQVVRRSDGSWTALSQSASPFRGADGELEGAVVSLTDITQRVCAQEQLRRAEASFRNVIAEAPDGITLQRDRTLVHANAAMLAMMGRSLDEVVGHSLAEFLHPDDRSTKDERIRTVLEERRSVPLKRERLVRPDGRLVEIETVAMPIVLEGEPLVLTISIDVSERNRGRRELEGIHASMLDGLIACDSSGHITHLNEAQARLIGRPGLRLHDRTLEEYALFIGLRHGDGTTMASAELPLSRALAGEIVQNEVFCFQGSGDDVCVRANAAPIRDESGAIVGAVAVNRDISDIIEVDRMRDQFIRVAAHELKTPIAVMKGYADVLLRAGDELRAPARAAAFAIERGALKIDRIVEELLDMSLVHTGQLKLRCERVDLAELVEAATQGVALASPKHRVRVVASEPVVVHADRARVAQVLSKLLDNGVRYSPRGGDVDVSCELRGDEAVVCVRDEGIGIPASKQDRLFERFYRPHMDTPFDYGGMGVGLYIARALVVQHGGRMWFDSKEGRGSTFCFALPVQPR